ncbi:MAG TPA: TspO/MBR family protein [Solirubrobacteraceae bacterium]|nr:TspO/MBR family protein [Solirubrobacteraceae bacterium]
MNVSRLRFAVAPVAVALGVGGFASRRAAAVYAELDKPRWAPPAELFGPVWSTLYTLIGLAGWRVDEYGSETTRRLHLIQLACNATWPVAFFERRDRRAAVAVIALLDLSLGTEVLRLGREDSTAARMLTPYLAWSLFASALTLAVSDPA